MLHHCRAVARGCQSAFRIGDLPFGSYQISAEKAVSNAIRLVQEGQVEAVKLEGRHLEAVEAITKAGIPVIGHVGLVPQSSNLLGGFKAQGKTAKNVILLLEEEEGMG